MMNSFLEQHGAKAEKVTLHTWTEDQETKKDHFYITGMPGAPISGWFRKLLRQKRLVSVRDETKDPGFV